MIMVKVMVMAMVMVMVMVTKTILATGEYGCHEKVDVEAQQEGNALKGRGRKGCSAEIESSTLKKKW